jgi:hypothetical protein
MEISIILFFLVKNNKEYNPTNEKKADNDKICANVLDKS